MELQVLIFIFVVSMLDPIHAAEKAREIYFNFKPQVHGSKNWPRNLVFHHSTNNKHYQEEQQYNSRYPFHSGKRPHLNDRQNQFSIHNIWHSIAGKYGPNINRKYEKRPYFNNLELHPQRGGTKIPIDREGSIADFVKHYNHQNKFKNHHKDFSFEKPQEEEFIIEEEPENYTPENHKNSSPHFSKDPSYDLSHIRFPDDDNSSDEIPIIFEDKFTLEKHKDQKNNYDRSPYNMKNDESSVDKNIDPELIELFKKILEVYKEKQKPMIDERKEYSFGNYDNKPVFIAEQKLPILPASPKPTDLFSKDGHNLTPTHEQHQTRKHYMSPRTVNIGHKNVYSNDFHPSPQIHKYSEPDPLYHPNGNPFEFRQPSYSSSTSSPLSNQQSTSFDTNNHQQDSREKYNIFLDTNNAKQSSPSSLTDSDASYSTATTNPPQETSSTQELTIASHLGASPSEYAFQPTTESQIVTQDTNHEHSPVTEPTDSPGTPDGSVKSTNLEQKIPEFLSTQYANEKKELFFLPTADTEDISGSASKEEHVIEYIDDNSKNLHNKSLFEGKYSGPTPLSISVSEKFMSSTTENYDFNMLFNHTTSKDSTSDIESIQKMNIMYNNSSENEKEKIKEPEDSRKNNKSTLYEISLKNETSTVAEQINEDDKLRPVAMKVTSMSDEEMFSDTKDKLLTFHTNTNTTGNNNYELQNSFNLTILDNKHEHEANSLFNTTNIENLKTTTSSDVDHIMMSIINQARSHVLLSENITQPEDII